MPENLDERKVHTTMFVAQIEGRGGEALIKSRIIGSSVRIHYERPRELACKKSHDDFNFRRIGSAAAAEDRCAVAGLRGGGAVLRDITKPPSKV